MSAFLDAGDVERDEWQERYRRLNALDTARAAIAKGKP